MLQYSNMHDIEPYYNWIKLYSSEADNKSPFFGREHSEFEFTQAIYNYYIHPQWDFFGSNTMYIKPISFWAIPTSTIRCVRKGNNICNKETTTKPAIICSTCFLY